MCVEDDDAVVASGDENQAVGFSKCCEEKLLRQLCLSVCVRDYYCSHIEVSVAVDFEERADVIGIANEAQVRTKKRRRSAFYIKQTLCCCWSHAHHCPGSCVVMPVHFAAAARFTHFFRWQKPKDAAVAHTTLLTTCPPKITGSTDATAGKRASSSSRPAAAATAVKKALNNTGVSDGGK